MNEKNIREKTKYTYFLNGLGCASCAVKIEEELRQNEKFNQVEFSFATKKLQLRSNVTKEILLPMLQNIIDGIEEGVQVETKKNGDIKEACEGMCDVDDPSKENKYANKSITRNRLQIFVKNNIQMILGIILVIGVLLIKPRIEITLVGYIISYVLIGRDVVLRAVKNLRKGNFFDEYFLMTIATIGAFVIGEYTEAVMVMFFYKLGEGFQDYAVDYSRRSIQALLNIKAEFANLIEDGITKKVIPESLKIGDYILVKVGEKIPVDGKIMEGCSFVDASALTGESLPRRIEVGDEVLSGMINQDQVLKFKVTKTYENSAVARILEMVENATSKKAKTEQFITKFAKIYTPIVVVSAFLLALIPPMLGVGEAREWIYRALLFLVISCPCALVLSVPLGYFAGLGKASRQGILIKGGNYLEALNKIDTFVFDKTGTLTKGNFRVQHVTGENTLAFAAHLEQFSTHPIAKAILEAYEETIEQEEVRDVKEKPGEGLLGTYRGLNLLVGNQRLMTRFGIETKKQEFVGAIVYVAYDNKYIGAIHIADEMKQGIENLFERLKEKGSKNNVMLTGDQENIAAQVAKEVGVDQYYSQLMPSDKLSHVEQMIAQGSKVLFVGDGINDAPVLVRANIGVAMGGLGSDAAIEAADIVLMTDEPMKLIDAINIARKTKRIVMQNIIFALGVKAFFLILGAFGIATMYEAIFADVGVAIIAVLNSMRILRK